MKGGTLFSGGGGFCLGMVAAGVGHAWGIEYDDAIAQVARDNGLATVTADILQCNPADFEPVDILHASPPCPNFSNAKANAEETENDRALAAKVCEFITELLPRVFTLENVYQYRNSQSWETIARTLLINGYQLNYWHVNMADYGVPQTRKRMIVIARRDGITPMLPPATHAENPIIGLFGTQKRWVSWYEAIEDLIPSLPDSEFAPWQLERLPDELRSVLVDSKNVNQEYGKRYRNEKEPAVTTTAIDRPSHMPRAFLLEKDKGEYSVNHKASNDPAPSVTTSDGGRRRAFICAQGKYDSGMPVYDQTQPNGTVTANSNQTGIKAFIVNDADSKNPIKASQEPMATVVTFESGGTSSRASVNGRIVKTTPRALARFQAFPDSYQLPDNNSLACRVIGNAVPPLFAQRLVESLSTEAVAE